jgi:electron transfer flavoprotein alpha subunit
MTLSGDPETAAARLLEALKARGLDASGHAAREPMLPLATAVEHPDPGHAVWAVAEWSPSEGGEADSLRHVSLELMGQAAALASQKGGPAVAVLLGRDVERFVPALAHHGASTVLLADAPELATTAPESYAWVLSRAIEQYRPWAVLLPATTFGRDIAPRVAAQLGLGLTGDCLGLEIEEKGRLLQMKPAFGGQVVAPITSKTVPAMATVRPGMLPRYTPDESRTAQVVRLDTRGIPASPVRVLSVTHEGEQGLALDNARLVVSIGMGAGGPESLDEVQRLARALGKWMGLDPEEIAIGGSRKVVDSGWLPRQQQIGITGRAVAPDLYLSLGVSGKFNHMVGILGAGTIAAVNNDADAPIMAGSDYCVISDWKSFADALLSLLQAGARDQ